MGLGWVGLKGEFVRVACARFGGVGDGWIGERCRVVSGLCSLSPWAGDLQRSVEELGGRSSYLRLACGACVGVHGIDVGCVFWMLLSMLEKLVRARLGSFG